MELSNEPSLKNFFIFKSGFDISEGEEDKKILYFYPPTEKPNTQVNCVGLVEAIVKFTGNFEPNCPVSALHTQKTRQLYYQPEKDYWMVLTINLPCVSKTKTDTSSGTTAYNEYIEADVHNNVFDAVLRQAYALFRIFHGTFAGLLTESDTVADNEPDFCALKKKLNTFYTAYVKSIPLPYCDILNVFAGIHFLPLDKQNFLNVQCFVNLLECNFKTVKNVSFLFNNSLIWSGIEPEDMRVIYQYLVSTLLPENVEKELQGGSIHRNQAVLPFTTVHYGRFIMGPTSLKGNVPSFVGKVPKVRLNHDENGHYSLYHFVVYRALSATICLYIDGNEELTMEMFRQLDTFLGPKLTSIASEVAEYCNKNINKAVSPDLFNSRFIYFNKLNLAYKSTVHLGNRQTGNVACSQDSLKIMADMNDRKDQLGYAGETIVKTMNDCWIVGRVSDAREFYIALQNKNSSLIEISDQVKRLSDNELNGIFFHPM